MLKSLPLDRIAACVEAAASSPMASPEVTYPTWYLQRWHFLPEGYLSRRSCRLYDTVIRRVYNAAAEARLHAALVRTLRRDRPRALLEIGCGPGNALRAIRRACPGTRLAGVDLSPFLLEMARERLPEKNADLRHGDATSLPWADGSFDAVLSQHVLGHLPGTAAAGAWREAARVLRPGGRLYLLEHRWHRRLPGPLRLVLRKPLLGGLIRLEAFEKATG